MALLRTLFAAALLCVGVTNATADVAVPSLQARVTDLTRTLPAGSVAELEQRLAAFEAKKGIQIAVLLVPTVQPDAIEQYAVRVFDQWQLGRKGVDDGVLLVIAKDDRKLRIEVGYGLEGVLTDVASKRIISDDIVPHLKRGNFAAGVTAGVARIMSVVSGEVLPAPAAVRRGRSSNRLFNPDWLIAGAVLLYVLNRVLRTVFGRLLAAGVVGALFGVAFWTIFSSVVAGFFVGAIAFFFSLIEIVPSRFGGGSGGWHSGGSWSSGGGGFSGGGGSSGGGGASGSW